MDSQEKLRRHLDLCRRTYLRMERGGTWPWTDRGNDGTRQAQHRVASAPRQLASAPGGKVPKRPIHAKICVGPVRLFDNSSSGSTSTADLMTVAQAAAFLTISKSSVRRLQQARRLPFIKVGWSIRFLTRDLHAYLEQRKVAPLDQ